MNCSLTSALSDRRIPDLGRRPGKLLARCTACRRIFAASCARRDSGLRDLECVLSRGSRAAGKAGELANCRLVRRLLLGFSADQEVELVDGIGQVGDSLAPEVEHAELSTREACRCS